MSDMSQNLYTARQVRNFDRVAIETSCDGYELMCLAGKSAYLAMRARWPGIHQVTIFCGPGNNGGDGYVLGKYALEAGVKVRAISLGEPKTDTAKRALEDYLKADGRITPWSESFVPEHGVIVDGLLGTGLEREVTGAYASAITCINDADSPVLALDIPSGLHADRGTVMGTAVRADLTVTFIGNKIGLHTGFGPDRTGDVICDTLDVPASVYATERPVAKIIDPVRDGLRLPRRARSAHKGTHGRVLLAGGDLGMSGSISMAAQSAARCGAGLIQVATRPEHVTQIISQRPEVMVFDAVDRNSLDAAIDAADVIAIGPGLGTKPWGQRLFNRILGSNRPMVLDADGLNLLAAAPQENAAWVLTPHPGEAARLLGIKGIPEDRVDTVGELQQRFGGVVVLKGAGTLIADGEELWLCDRGNPGMASGGMGDVLTGVVAALIAQGQTPSAAARFGVWLHAAAADKAAAAHGEIGLMATDLLAPMRDLLNAGV